MNGADAEALARASLANSAERFLFEARHAHAVSTATLKAMLELNGDTVRGRAHGLSGPGAIEAFRRHPLTRYHDYSALIERAAAGEPDVLSRDRLAYFAHTSGTTGGQKLLPITAGLSRVHRRDMGLPIGLALRAGLFDGVPLRYLQLIALAQGQATSGGYPVASVTGQELDLRGPLLAALSASPRLAQRVTDPVTARYVHLRFALGTPAVTALGAAYPMILIYMMQDLHDRAEALLRDVATGTLSPALALSHGEREGLEALLEPAPDRARMLEKLLGTGRVTAAEVWPSLRVALTIVTGAFRAYLAPLREVLGEVQVFSPLYLCAESPIAIGLPDREGFVLSPSSVFAELLPVAATGDGAARRTADAPEARGHAEVEGAGAWEPHHSAEIGEEESVDPTALEGLATAEEGRLYELVITTWAGLVRYRLGDIVRVIGRYGEAPVLEVVERTAPVLRVLREKLTERQVCEAVEAASTGAQVAVADFVMTVDPDRTPAGYLLVCSFRSKLSGAPSDAAEPWLEAFVGALDRQLQTRNADYAAYRRQGLLGTVQVQSVPAGAFEQWWRTRASRGGAGWQVKTPRLVQDRGALPRALRGP